jgi:hypothetical protein
MAVEAVMLTPEEEVRKAQLLQELQDLEDRARARLARWRERRTYRFADAADPEDLATIRRFQQIFGRHIPFLLEDEHATIHLHQRLLDGIFGNPIETINKSTFEADLKRFRKAIKTLAEWPIWGTMITMVPSSPEVWDDENVEHVALKIYECLLWIEDMADNKTLPQVLDQLEGWAREASEQLPDRRNINWVAVNAVDSLRRFWESWTETSAPSRALNQASPFADYLRDAFEFFNISGDPVAAFKRWVAVEDAHKRSKWHRSPEKN